MSIVAQLITHAAYAEHYARHLASRVVLATDQVRGADGDLIIAVKRDRAARHERVAYAEGLEGLRA
jgi:urease alpha subunit